MRRWGGDEPGNVVEGSRIPAQGTWCPKFCTENCVPTAHVQPGARTPLPRTRLAPQPQHGLSNSCPRRRLAAAQAAQRDSRGRSLSPSRRPEHRARPESQARRQRPPAVPGRPARLPPARPLRPPRLAQHQWKARDRPSAPQSSWARTPPPRPPPPSFKGWGRPPRGAAWGNY